MILEESDSFRVWPPTLSQWMTTMFDPSTQYIDAFGIIRPLAELHGDALDRALDLWRRNDPNPAPVQLVRCVMAGSSGSLSHLGPRVHRQFTRAWRCG